MWNYSEIVAMYACSIGPMQSKVTWGIRLCDTHPWIKPNYDSRLAIH